MNDEEVLATVIDAIGQETGNAPSEITPEMTASDVPGWDSLAHVRILLEIGVKLGVAVDIEKTYRAATIRDLVPIVRESPRA
ncbi:MAG: acyl carrier protein [Reyranella sp.]|uniref:acyl carrier protein n=1 Tax=Reyranella sp. TaxID=1929291 RepID=UPI003D0A81E6